MPVVVEVGFEGLQIILTTSPGEYPLPPLLKGYLRLGAYVSEGAYIDKQFDTIDVCIVLKSNFLKKRYVNFHNRDKKDPKVVFLKKIFNKNKLIK